MTCPTAARGMVAETIRQIRLENPGTSIEVLISDLNGRPGDIRTVVEAQPDILNHNVETVPRLQRAGPPARALGSVRLGAHAGPHGRQRDRLRRMVTKTGIMLGLGETWDEIVEAMRLLREADVDVLTIGQYLRPSRAAPAAGEVLHAGRVHGAAADRPRDGLQARPVRAARALVLPRRRAGARSRGRRRRLTDQTPMATETPGFATSAPRRPRRDDPTPSTSARRPAATRRPAGSAPPASDEHPLLLAHGGVLTVERLGTVPYGRRGSSRTSWPSSAADGGSATGCCCSSTSRSTRSVAAATRRTCWPARSGCARWAPSSSASTAAATSRSTARASSSPTRSSSCAIRSTCAATSARSRRRSSTPPPRSA